MVVEYVAVTKVREAERGNLTAKQTEERLVQLIDWMDKKEIKEEFFFF